LGVVGEMEIDSPEEIQAWAWVVQRLEHSSTRSMGSAVRHLLRFRSELSQEELGRESTHLYRHYSLTEAKEFLSAVLVGLG